MNQDIAFDNDTFRWRTFNATVTGRAAADIRAVTIFWMRITNTPEKTFSGSGTTFYPLHILPGKIADRTLTEL
jgi:hypothetical protein